MVEQWPGLSLSEPVVVKPGRKQTWCERATAWCSGRNVFTREKRGDSAVPVPLSVSVSGVWKVEGGDHRPHRRGLSEGSDVALTREVGAHLDPSCGTSRESLEGCSPSATS